MPLPLALPIGLLVGMSLAWLARVELARSDVPLVLARPFLVAAALGAIVYGPVVAYFVMLHGDWAYLYLVRSSRIPSAVDLTLIFLAAAHVPLGFALASPWAIAKRGSALLKVGAVIGAIVVLTCTLAARRLAVSASFAQYHAGFGVMPLAKTPLGRGVLLSWLTLLAAFGWSARVIKAPRPG
ncbi:MAG TPA: hypothetical protein VM580_29710 [Labilithrix sp.]|nr:hypothetical protein [Labilithrix sp.]